MDTRIERINELEDIINKARKERDLLKNEIINEKNKNINNERKKYIGKCFILINKNIKSKSYENVYAFKILSFEQEDERELKYVRCLTLCNGYNKSCWKEIGIINQVMSLWSPDTLKMISSPQDIKTIDLFKEISNEDFKELLNKSINKLVIK